MSNGVVGNRAQRKRNERASQAFELLADRLGHATGLRAHPAKVFFQQFASKSKSRLEATDPLVWCQVSRHGKFRLRSENE